MEQEKQESTKALEKQAMKVETFNPHWHNGEFLGPNTLRHEKDMDVYGKEES